MGIIFYLHNFPEYFLLNKKSLTYIIDKQHNNLKLLNKY